MKTAPSRAAALHVAADVFLIVFGSAFAGGLLFCLMVIFGGSVD